MNIVHFTDTYHPLINGVTMAVEQYTEKASQNNNVLVFAPSYSVFSKETKQGRVTKKYVRSIPFPIYPGVHAALPNLIGMYRMLKKFKPDIIHIHSPFVLGILGVIFSQILGVKLIGTYHTLFSMGSMYLSPKRLLPGAKLDSATESEHTVLAQIAWKLQLIFFNICDSVIAPTKIIATTLKKQGIKSPVVVLPSGVSLEQYPVKTDFTPTNKLIHLGRLGYEKATDTLLRALSIVQKELPKLELIIVGDGPAKDYLKKLTKELNLQKKVIFVGMVPNKETPRHYRSCDAFITASPFETQGLVLIEAMLSGLPVIAASVNAPIDLIAPGKNGFLFQEGDIEGCAQYIRTLYKNPDTIKTMGLSARVFAEQFDSTKTSDKLLAHYRSLLKAQRA
ncbi:MAG: glycosyltransferase [Patescibacteria group bacterium]